MTGTIRFDRAMFRRGLFVGAHMVLLLAVYWFIVVPLTEAFAARDAQIADDGVLLARYRAVAAQRDAVTSLARRADAAPAADLYLHGPSESEIDADLQARLKRVAETAGARLRAVRTLPQRTLDGNSLAGARVELTSSLSTMHRALADIETQAPYLFVTSAALRPASETGALSPRRGDKPPPLADPGAMVEATLDIYGAWRKDPSGD